MKSLQELHRDKESLENLRNYLLEQLEKKALNAVFAREDISGIADAKELIEDAFENLDTMFAPESKINDKNQSR